MTKEPDWTVAPPLSVTRWVHHRVRDLLFSGALRPGEIINELEVARQLGVSRTPIREALRELSANDLVRFVPRRGFQVVCFSASDIQEVFDLREVLELEAVGRAVTDGSPADLAGLRDLVTRTYAVSDQGDFTLFVDLNRQFHREICVLTRNQRMVSMLERLEDMVHLMFVEAFKNTDRMQRGQEEHAAILTLIEKGQKSQAQEAMYQHLEDNKSAVIRHYRRGDEG